MIAGSLFLCYNAVKRKGESHMWTRKDLKTIGKAALHRNYWVTVLVTLIYGFLAADYSDRVFDFVKESLSDNPVEMWGPVAWTILAVGVTIILIWTVIMILVRIFIGNMIEIGSMRYYLENSEKKSSLGLILYGFQSGHYGKNTLTLFLRDLYSVLWTLLLIVPGIIKSLEYSMIPYILAENPQMSRKRAFELSKAMMDGQKWDAFVLDLSFVGWFILGGITLGVVDVMYTNPYVNTTWAELYKVSRRRALEKGFATSEELPGIIPE